MVSIKHKVTIKEKTAQEEISDAIERPVVTLKIKQSEVAPDTKPEVIPPSAPVPGPEKKPNTGKIVAGTVVTAAILAGVYFFGIKGDDNAVDDGGASTEQLAQAGEITQTADATEDATPGKETTANNESETPTPAEANETPASGDNSSAVTSAKADEKQAEKPSATETLAAKPIQPAQPNSSSTTSAKQSTASAPISSDVVENAKRVIRGDFGNGQERKDMLGSAYAEIQDKVNEMYRQGLVH